MNEQATAILETLGFSAYEARAYLGLLQESPMNGYQLSKLTGLPRSRVYETLQRLTSKGYAVRFPTDPVQYAPLSVGELQLRLKEQFSDNLSTLEAELEHIATSGRSESLWNLYGHESIMQRVRGMIARAETAIYLVAWAQTLQWLKADLEAAVARGVRLVIISCGGAETMPGIHYCHAFENEIVQEETDAINLVVDGREVLVGETLPADNCYAFWSHNTNLVRVTEEYIRHEVYLHKIIERLGVSAAETLQQALADGLQEIPYAK